MPYRLPNPYQPATAIGQGLDNIAKGIFGMGRMNAYGRYRRGRGSVRYPSQIALDEAQTRKNQAETRKIDFEADEQQRSNEFLQEDNLSQLGADTANLPRLIYDNLKAVPPTGAHPPLAAAGYTEDERKRGRIGRITEAFFARNKEPNPKTFAESTGVIQSQNDLADLIAGNIKPDTYARAKGAIEGKELYGSSGGVDYHKYTGKSSPNAIGSSTIGKNTKLGNKYDKEIEYKEQQTATSKSQEDLNREKIKSGGFAPKSDKMKHSAINKEVKDSMAAQISLRLGIPAEDLGDMDPDTIADVLAQGIYHYVTPGSPTKNNPSASIDAAIERVAPQGFNSDGSAVGGRAGIRHLRGNPDKPKTIMEATQPSGGESYEDMKRRLYPDG